MTTQRNKNLSRLYNHRTKSINFYCNSIHDKVNELYESLMDNENPEYIISDIIELLTEIHDNIDE